MTDKATDTERNEKKLFLEIKANAYSLSWNVDISFAKMMLPVLESFLKRGANGIDWGLSHLNKFEVFFIHNKRKWISKSSLVKKYVEYRRKSFLKKLNLSLETLKDMLNDNPAYLKKRWDILPLCPIKFDNIETEIIGPSGKKEKGYQMVPKKGYEEASDYNTSIVLHNFNREKLRKRWRDKNLKWFIYNMDKLWW